MPSQSWDLYTKSSESLSSLHTFFQLRHAGLQRFQSAKDEGVELEAEAAKPRGSLHPTNLYLLTSLFSIFAWLLSLDLSKGFDTSLSSIGLGFAWSLPLLAMSSLLQTLDLEPIKEIQALTEAFARKLFSGRPDYQLILFCICAGFGEELLFRGVLQQKLAESAGLIPAISLTSVAFGAAHFLTPTYFLLSFIGSIFFGVVLIQSNGNLLVPIIAHAVYDYVAVRLTLKQINEK
ncbi:hypothetical protein GUITHDRAFT_145849 [Guillardia theta CCMP2712]|uniref:CAAX prenyl protease 2/Lysostaphin resistance protein A-like domain-containing protein n=1 Tax=Guillardia theta (strain CCMP2712) TaxID=905079 RepID=L1IJ81_GUITC|nr:hypothetical protein GUITHDRAFT_145849 [Guillardia theta CCMP2712]EKX36276.1 hypothetical protein GUITHDRAFT_145849 [Guillardia theta CCMP2712]|eukprot:XP_005823256.1 hypothetical protein GUITHDRAFT_145849 [Guillardia theta CCMP2712]